MLLNQIIAYTNVVSLFLCTTFDSSRSSDSNFDKLPFYQMYPIFLVQNFFLHYKICPKTFPPKYAKSDRKCFRRSFSSKTDSTEFFEFENNVSIFCIDFFFILFLHIFISIASLSNFWYDMFEPVQDMFIMIEYVWIYVHDMFEAVDFHRVAEVRDFLKFHIN